MTNQPMQPIRVSRYESNDEVGWNGCISPEDGSWTIFVDNDDRPHLYVREPQIVETEEPLNTIDEETGDVFEVLVHKWSPDRQ